METLSNISSICGYVIGIITTITFFVKPLRNKLFGLDQQQEGIKCLIRTQILQIYYDGKQNGGRIQEYQAQNAEQLYSAYKSLKGNSFIDNVVEKIREFDIYE